MSDARSVADGRWAAAAPPSSVAPYSSASAKLCSLPASRSSKQSTFLPYLRAASRADGSSAAVDTKTTLASESLRMYSHSSGFCCSYMGTCAAPAAYAPYIVATNSSRFLLMTATRSPRSTP